MDDCDSIVVTPEMITAALHAFRPYLDEMGHLDSLSAREAVEAGLRAALRVRFAVDQRESKGGY